MSWFSKSIEKARFGRILREEVIPAEFQSAKSDEELAEFVLNTNPGSESHLKTEAEARAFAQSLRSQFTYHQHTIPPEVLNPDGSLKDPKDVPSHVPRISKKQMGEILRQYSPPGSFPPGTSDIQIAESALAQLSGLQQFLNYPLEVLRGYMAKRSS